MNDCINPDAAAWLEENERLHRAGRLHSWRMFGMIGCRLCQAEHDASRQTEQQAEARPR